MLAAAILFYSVIRSRPDTETGVGTDSRQWAKWSLTRQEKALGLFLILLSITISSISKAGFLPLWSWSTVEQVILLTMISLFYSVTDLLNRKADWLALVVAQFAVVTAALSAGNYSLVLFGVVLIALSFGLSSLLSSDAFFLGFAGATSAWILSSITAGISVLILCCGVCGLIWYLKRVRSKASNGEVGSFRAIPVMTVVSVLSIAGSIVVNELAK